VNEKRFPDLLFPAQLSLGFPAPAPRFENLFCAAANQSAFSLLQRPGDWALPILCLVGPPKCGLTAAATAWSEMTGCRFFDAAAPAFADQPSAELAKGCTLDDADKAVSEDQLLTLINLVSSGSGRLLLTAHTPPPLWNVQSPDLKSRLNAMTIAQIHAPDEAMARGRLRAGGERYAFKFEDETLNFLVPRLELSYDAIETLVLAVNAGITRTGRGPTIPLVREILDRLDPQPLNP
jgi:hypothetical protein